MARIEQLVTLIDRCPFNAAAARAELARLRDVVDSIDADAAPERRRRTA
jgi:hypothetical protein